MAHDADDQHYLDYVADDPEMIAGTPLSSPDLGIPQHAIPAANVNRTTPNPGLAGQPPPRNPPVAPAYSYPTTISNQRSGSRAFQSPASSTASTSSSLHVSASAGGNTAPFPTFAPPRPINTAPTPTFQTTGDWQSSGSGSIYSGSASPVVSLHSNPNPYDFQYGPSAPDQSFGDFVTPSNIHHVQPGFDFTYPWSAGGDSADGIGGGMGLSSSLPGQLPSGMHPGLSLGASPEDFSEGAEVDDTRPSSSKRAKKSPAASDRASLSSQGTHASLGPHGTISATPLDTGTGKQKPMSKLRSAARTSKNQVHRPSETAEERKSRNSHNIVEKQYRNRLNARFESLLNALPDTIRGEGGSGEDGEMQNFDIGEKRVSKAEVLDMARRHIQSLERDRDALEKERDELLENMEKLRGTYAEGIQRGGQASEETLRGKGKGKEPDSEEEEEEDEEGE